MFNKLYIIIDKRSTKPYLIWKFSFLDLVFMCLAFLVAYIPLKIFVDELSAIILGLGFFSILGFLLVEMPDHLSILQHIQMWYDYTYNKPKEYFYIPKSEVNKFKQIEEDKEQIEWNEYQEMIRKNMQLK